MQTKICTRCKIEKPIDCFYFIKTRNVYMSHCKSCDAINSNIRRKTEKGKIRVNKAQKKYRSTEKGKITNRKSAKKHSTTLKKKYSIIKNKCKKYNLDFSITKEEYAILLEQKCYYCDDLLSIDIGTGIGLDRIDNKKGYAFDNVLRCCGFCNKTRLIYLSVEEMKEVAQLLINLRVNKNNSYLELKY